jgi:hypothetical protein
LFAGIIENVILLMRRRKMAAAQQVPVATIQPKETDENHKDI